MMIQNKLLLAAQAAMKSTMNQKHGALINIGKRCFYGFNQSRYPNCRFIPSHFNCFSVHAEIDAIQRLLLQPQRGKEK